MSKKLKFLPIILAFLLLFSQIACSKNNSNGIDDMDDIDELDEMDEEDEIGGDF